MADLRKYWVGSVGPFTYDADEPLVDRSGVFGGAPPGQSTLVTEGTVFLGGLAVSKLTGIDADGYLENKDLSDFADGSGGVDVGDDGDGTVTINGHGGGCGAVTGKTISGGAISITDQYHVQLTGEGDAADDLTSITGGEEGDKLVLRGKTGLGYTITIKDAGNLHLQADFGINSEYDTLYLLNIGSNHWVELSRANNA